MVDDLPAVSWEYYLLRVAGVGDLYAGQHTEPLLCRGITIHIVHRAALEETISLLGHAGWEMAGIMPPQVYWFKQAKRTDEERAK